MKVTLALVSIALSTPLALAVRAQDVGERVPLKYPVEHNHRNGSCRGELTIDKWVFTYTSEDRPEDSRSWKVTDVKEVSSKTPQELVVKTKESSVGTIGQDRNYKFKVLGAGIEREVVDFMIRRVK
jgi:hypothetical protein